MITCPRRLPPHDPRSDRGFTLVELLVVITILAVVGTALLGFTLTVERTTRSSTQRLEDLGDARLGVNAATRQLRGVMRVNPGDPLLETAGNDILLFRTNTSQGGAPGQQGPLLVRLQVNANGEFVEERWRPTQVPSPPPAGQENMTHSYPNPATDPPITRRVLARNVINGPGEPVFRYKNYRNCNPLQDDQNQSDFCTSLSFTGADPDDPDDVTTVEIDLIVRQDGQPQVSSSRIQTEVLLRNHTLPAGQGLQGPTGDNNGNGDDDD